MKEKENEKNAINAFIDILKPINGQEYEPYSWPENDNRETEDVEVILDPKDKNKQFPKIAVEHTIVEAHNKQINYVKQLGKILNEVNLKCQSKLPTDRYFYLMVPPLLIMGTKKKNNQLVEEISDWILDVTGTLAVNQHSSRLYNEHKVSLLCNGSCPKQNGKVHQGPMRPEDTEREKQKRFRRSIENKLPKLIKYKENEYKYDTALLLEDISGSFFNPENDIKKLIPEKCLFDFQSKVDYVVIFVSNNNKMIVGNVWKDKSQLYSVIPDNRKFVMAELQSKGR